MRYASECTANWEAYAFFLLFLLFSHIHFFFVRCTYPFISIPMNHIGLEWNAQVSVSQRDETIIILLMGISGWSIPHFKKADKQCDTLCYDYDEDSALQNNQKCVWFRTILYCSVRNVFEVSNCCCEFIWFLITAMWPNT